MRRLLKPVAPHWSRRIVLDTGPACSLRSTQPLQNRDGSGWAGHFGHSQPATQPRSSRLHGGDASETVWLFDLDNTLHDCSRAIFSAIHTRMTTAIMTLLDVDIDAANRLRILYWKRYGATVIGMVRHHDVDPHHFLALSHAFEAGPLIHAERGLVKKFSLLEGRKVLLTNAPLEYARDVLKTLGLLHHFESLWTISHMCLQGRIRPKPSVALMRQVLARLAVPARQVILVEDTLKNLKAARQVGMRTVHIHHPETPFSNLSRGRPAYVDLRVNTLGALLSKRRLD